MIKTYGRETERDRERQRETERDRERHTSGDIDKRDICKTESII